MSHMITVLLQHFSQNWLMLTVKSHYIRDFRKDKRCLGPSKAFHYSEYILNTLTYFLQLSNLLRKNEQIK